MTSNDFTKLNVEKFEELNSQNKLSYDLLFAIVNHGEDLEVCRKSRSKLYEMIAIDFLKNYLLDDFFDKSKNESYDIFEFLLNYVQDNGGYLTVLLDYLKNGSSEKVIRRAWDIVRRYDLSFGDLSSVICFTSSQFVQESAWDEYIKRINAVFEGTNEEDENPMDSLFDIFNKCNHEEFVSESWTLLRRTSTFEGTDLDLVITNANPKIVEYAWKYLDTAKLKESELVQIVKQTSSKKIAHEALDLLRTKKH